MNLKTLSKLSKLISAALLCAACAFSQASLPGNETRVGGLFFPAQYGQWQGKISTGTTATGAGTITLYTATVALPDGRVIMPYAITAPLLVGAGATAETVTPTAVSGCVKTQPGIGLCSITATFSNVHGAGEIVQSGTFGLEEAVNDANLAGGGVIVIDSAWVAAGGLNATITGNKGFTNTPIVDARGTTASGSAFSYKAASNGAAYTITAISWY